MAAQALLVPNLQMAKLRPGAVGETKGPEAGTHIWGKGIQVHPVSQAFRTDS